MDPYGRPLRRVGALRLLALPGVGGRERYCLVVGLKPDVTHLILEQVLAAFAAVCDPTDEAAHRRQFAARGVTDLTAYRRRRRRPRGDATEGRRPAGAEEP